MPSKVQHTRFRAHSGDSGNSLTPSRRPVGPVRLPRFLHFSVPGDGWAPPPLASPGRRSIITVIIRAEGWGGGGKGENAGHKRIFCCS
jgi:hypothetical protein